jgi:pimeloyl-ACP methyl ester carboxylesterase
MVVPPRNGELLAKSIPGAELKLWPGAGHFYITDEPEADRYNRQFLLRHTSTVVERSAA